MIVFKCIIRKTFVYANPWTSHLKHVFYVFFPQTRRTFPLICVLFVFFLQICLRKQLWFFEHTKRTEGLDVIQSAQEVYKSGFFCRVQWKQLYKYLQMLWIYHLTKTSLLFHNILLPDNFILDEVLHISVVRSPT